MGVGHFGSLVIGEEQAAREAAMVKSGAVHFGPLVIGEQPHIAGPLVVTEEDVKPPEHEPKGLSVDGLSVEELKTILPSVDELDTIKEWLASEDRKGARKLLEARIAELSEDEEE